MKVVKSVLKKAPKDNRDPWLAMLDQRNTPTESLGASPAQRLMSRRTRTLLPTATSLLYPKVPNNVPEMLKLKRQKAKWYFDRSARPLPEIDVGQEVRVAPLQKNENWKMGTCLEKLLDRSYLVKTDASSQVLCRNREFLKPAEKLTVIPKPVEGEESQPSNRETPTVVPEDKQPTATSHPPVKATRTRETKPPSRFSDYVT